MGKVIIAKLFPILRGRLLKGLATENPFRLTKFPILRGRLLKKPRRIPVRKEQ